LKFRLRPQNTLSQPWPALLTIGEKGVLGSRETSKSGKQNGRQIERRSV
jgi:hypothetical protein